MAPRGLRTALLDSSLRRTTVGRLGKRRRAWRVLLEIERLRPSGRGSRPAAGAKPLI